MFSEGEAPQPAETEPPAAWHPLTPRGVAAFASASFGRVLLAQLIFAVVIAAVILWFLAVNWAPVIAAAVQKLPDSGVLQNGELHGVSSRALAKNRFLAIVIDLEETDALGQTSDLQVVLLRNGFNVCSLPGCLPLAYPRTNPTRFGHTALEPWWGAWKPMVLTVAALSVVVKLFIGWGALATLYMFIVRSAGFYADREITWGGSWRVAAAALLPGALLLGVALILYGIAAVDLIRLGLLFLLHFVVGWVYLAASVFALPRLPTARLTARSNPFSGSIGPVNRD